MSHYLVHIYQQYPVNPQVTQSLVISSINNQQVTPIKKFIQPFVITSKVFNRNNYTTLRYRLLQYNELTVIHYQIEYRLRIIIIV